VQAVVFDWDGTLVDSAEVTFRCYERVFASYGIPFTREAYERTYSPNWRHTYTSLGLPLECWPEADTRWLSYYAEEESRLLPGARELLERLRGAGFTLGLVTAGEGGRVRGELEQHQLARFFATAVFGGDTERRKPHPDPLLLALARLGIAPGAAMYVGDSPEDVEMARAAGVSSIGILGGFPNREALHASRPQRIVSDLASVAEALLAS
jgi:HAD superfamily hydrolase (TIGR01509 family)